MRLSRLNLLALIPVFGLVSCTPDKHRTVADSWNLPEPMAVTVVGDQVRRVPLSQASEGALDATTFIEFAGLSIADTAMTSFEIEANCQTGSDTLIETMSISGSARFSLVGLLPHAALQNRDLSGIEKLDCSLTFHSSDTIGSTKDFVFSGIRLTKIASLETSAFSDYSLQTQSVATSSPKVLAAQSASNMNVLPLPAVELASDYDLYCDHFHNHRSTAPGDDGSRVVDELIHGTIEGRDVHVQPFDPRDSFTDQSCRLIVRTTNPITKVADVSVTPIFELKYPLAKSEMTPDLDFHAGLRIQPAGGMLNGSFIRYDYLGAASFLTIKLHNLSSAPEAFVFAVPNTLTFANVEDMPNEPQSSLPIQATLTFEAFGDAHRWGVGNNTIFEISPGSTLTIGIKTKDNWVSADGISGLPASNLGDSYSFNGPTPLQQLINWDSSAPLLTGATEPVALKGVHYGPSGDLSGWFQDPAFAGRPPPSQISHPGGVGLSAEIFQ